MQTRLLPVVRFYFPSSSFAMKPVNAVLFFGTGKTLPCCSDGVRCGPRLWVTHAASLEVVVQIWPIGVALTVRVRVAVLKGFTAMLLNGWGFRCDGLQGSGLPLRWFPLRCSRWRCRHGT